MFTLLPPKTFSKHFGCFDCEFPCTRSKSNRLAEGRGGVLPSDRILLRDGFLLLKTFIPTTLDPTLISSEILIAL